MSDALALLRQNLGQFAHKGPTAIEMLRETVAKAAGHKYISRDGGPGHWNYTYADEAKPHDEASHIADKTSSGALVKLPSHPDLHGKLEDAAGKKAVSDAPPKTNIDAVHAAHPNFTTADHAEAAKSLQKIMRGSKTLADSAYARKKFDAYGDLKNTWHMLASQADAHQSLAGEKSYGEKKAASQAREQSKIAAKEKAKTDWSYRYPEGDAAPHDAAQHVAGKTKSGSLVSLPSHPDLHGKIQDSAGREKNPSADSANEKSVSAAHPSFTSKDHTEAAKMIGDMVKQVKPKADDAYAKKDFSAYNDYKNTWHMLASQASAHRNLAADRGKKEDLDALRVGDHITSAVPHLHEIQQKFKDWSPSDHAAASKKLKHALANPMPKFKTSDETHRYRDSLEASETAHSLLADKDKPYIQDLINAFKPKSDESKATSKSAALNILHDTLVKAGR